MNPILFPKAYTFKTQKFRRVLVFSPPPSSCFLLLILFPKKMNVEWPGYLNVGWDRVSWVVGGEGKYHPLIFKQYYFYTT